MINIRICSVKYTEKSKFNPCGNISNRYLIYFHVKIIVLKYCDEVSNNNWTQNSIYVKTNKIKHFTIPNTIQLSVSEACHKK